MPDTPIPPALTPDEWTAGVAVRGATRIERTDERTLLIENPSSSTEQRAYVFSAELGPVLAFANAALPDGHPHKITQEDVALLRRLADDTIAWSVADHGLDDALRAVANKLAALLPIPRPQERARGLLERKPWPTAPADD